MYSKNTSNDKRHLSGWGERRRYFRNFFSQVRAKVLKDVEIPKEEPLSKKD